MVHCPCRCRAFGHPDSGKGLPPGSDPATELHHQRHCFVCPTDGGTGLNTRFTPLYPSATDVFYEQSPHWLRSFWRSRLWFSRYLPPRVHRSRQARSVEALAACHYLVVRSRVSLCLSRFCCCTRFLSLAHSLSLAQFQFFLPCRKTLSLAKVHHLDPLAAFTTEPLSNPMALQSTVCTPF